MRPRTGTQTHRRAWPQYISRRLRLTRNAMTENRCHQLQFPSIRYTKIIRCRASTGRIWTKFAENWRPVVGGERWRPSLERNTLLIYGPYFLSQLAQFARMPVSWRCLYTTCLCSGLIALFMWQVTYRSRLYAHGYVHVWTLAMFNRRAPSESMTSYTSCLWHCRLTLMWDVDTTSWHNDVLLDHLYSSLLG